LVAGAGGVYLLESDPSRPTLPSPTPPPGVVSEAKAIEVARRNERFGDSAPATATLKREHVADLGTVPPGNRLVWRVIFEGVEIETEGPVPVENPPPARCWRSWHVIIDGKTGKYLGSGSEGKTYLCSSAG
jgi:hypothetical protein